MNAKQIIESGKAILGIEFGSTRIKAVLIDPENKPIAQGSHTWENQLVDGLWTYSTEAIWYGLQDCYADLRKNVLKEYDCEIETLAAIGFSAMMHGYMPFNEKGDILVPFRTWRNTNTGKAAAELSKLFVYNIPLRWSISHLYEAILDNEEHVKDITFLTTLAGYVHWQVTGQKVLGVGDASGMEAVGHPPQGSRSRRERRLPHPRRCSEVGRKRSSEAWHPRMSSRRRRRNRYGCHQCRSRTHR